MTLLRKMLFPLSAVYYGVTQVRNSLYDKGVFNSKAYQLPVICVGNLSVGGTGKSPMIEYLIELLAPNFKVAVLSRGYKRNTNGYLEVNLDHSADQVGDEPLQFKTKFPKLTVAVCADRQEGIAQLKDKAEVILLDDAFQHRKVKAGFNILLTTFKKPFYSDFLLPVGDLRESRAGAKRADVIIITKVPDRVPYATLQEMQFRARQFEDQQVFTSQITYSDTVVSKTHNLELDFFRSKPFTLVTGIAKPRPLLAFLKEQKMQFEHLQFPDHHKFSESELKTIQSKELVLTTEKDYMRLKDGIDKKALYYLPIKTKIMEREGSLEDMLLDFIHTYWNKIV